MITDKGQTLIEMVVALGLAIVIVGAITILTVNGLRNSSQSRNQTLGTKLAQQLMDQVKSFSNQNCTVLAGSPSLFWNTSFSGQNFQVTTGSYCLTQVSNTFSSSFLAPVDPMYSYKIFINNPPATPSLVEVTVIVSWSDTVGSHNATLVSDITEM